MRNIVALRSFRKLLNRFNADGAGTIAIISAAVLPFAVAATALAVDVGSLYVERRQAQSAADLAAIAAASDLSHADAVANDMLRINGITNIIGVTVTKGRFTPDASIAPAQRFQAGAEPYNAVRVDLVKKGRVYFANAFRRGEVDMSVKSIAVSSAMATFSIGSRLLALRDGLLNQLLGSMLGANVSLSLMDYNALVGADVKLGDLLDGVASQLSLTAVTYSDLLSTSMTTGNVFDAAASVVDKTGNTSASLAFKQLASQAGSTRLPGTLSSLINVGPLGTLTIGQGGSALSAGVNALDLVTGMAALANGANQVALDLGATVPGLLSLKADLTIGERAKQSPMVAVGQEGATVYTAQTRLRLVAEIGGSGLLAGVRLRLPIGIDLAFATGTLSNVTCSANDPSANRATISTSPGIARAWIGETSLSSMSNFQGPPTTSAARIIDTGLVKVTGRSDISVSSMSATPLTFTQTDVTNSTIKRAETTNFTESIVTSLLGNLTLQVQVLGFGIPIGIGSAVTDILAGVAAPLDQIVLELLNTLGVHLGEADVRVLGINCTGAALFG